MLPRPTQNRVSPFGVIEAARWRGQFMGNRGRLGSDGGPAGRWTSRAWITCTLVPKPRPGIKPEYTKLFFSDEAASLAAGFRPCAQCRRGDFKRFCEAWCAARRIPSVRAPELDGQLRRDCRERGRRPFVSGSLADLPDHVFVELAKRPGEAWRLVKGELRHWLDGQYPEGMSAAGAGAFRLVTPSSTVHVLRSGYAPLMSEFEVTARRACDLMLPLNSRPPGSGSDASSSAAVLVKLVG